jgi:hypothetical protein
VTSASSRQINSDFFFKIGGGKFLDFSMPKIQRA